MIIIKSITDLKIILNQWKSCNMRIAFVPTMGKLHEGHISLIKRALENAHKVLVSIFINPMQFNNKEDFIKYPKNLKKDIEILKIHKVDLLFIPTVQDMYPLGCIQNTIVNIPSLSNILEGKKRKGHFLGVTTIISKFFNIIKPDIVVLGEKDFQQLFIIKKLIQDMYYNDIILIEVPTVRNSNGLALSSRNSLLSNHDIQKASKINLIIKKLSKNLNLYNINKKLKYAKSKIIKYGFQLEDLFIRDSDNLQKINKNTKYAIIIIVVKLSNIRLTDSIKTIINQ